MRLGCRGYDAVVGAEGAGLLSESRVRHSDVNHVAALEGTIVGQFLRRHLQRAGAGGFKTLGAS